MGALNAIVLRLGGAWALLLAPLAAQATLHLYGPSDWKRGEHIVFEVRTHADTVLYAYQFVTQYSSFANVLEIVNDPKTTLPAVIAPPNPDSICNPYAGGGIYGDACTFSSTSPALVPQDTVVTRWEFLVKSNAPIGPVASFDLGVMAVTESDPNSERPVPWWPEDGVKQFNVVPEASSWILMLAGLAAVGVRSYQRRMGRPG